MTKGTEESTHVWMGRMGYERFGNDVLCISVDVFTLIEGRLLWADGIFWRVVGSRSSLTTSRWWQGLPEKGASRWNSKEFCCMCCEGPKKRGQGETELDRKKKGIHGLLLYSKFEQRSGRLARNGGSPGGDLSNWGMSCRFRIHQTYNIVPLSTGPQAQKLLRL